MSGPRDTSLKTQLGRVRGLGSARKVLFIGGPNA
jgi:hypothetical protein